MFYLALKVRGLNFNVFAFQAVTVNRSS